MDVPRPLVPVIVGPTAVGKTAVAVALAARWPMVVISADSRQVYRDLDIGTAKPTEAERAAVTHLGIDVIAPGERYSAGRFARDAAGWLATLGRDVHPVVVGGTGFYVKALADGLFREPPLDRERLQRIRQWSESAGDLGRWAARFDPTFRGGGRQRASRVVEVALLTGRPLSWWQSHAKAEGIMQPWYVRLTAPRAVLHDRIATRVHRMLAAGWIDEVRGVLASGVPADAPGLDAVGYREIVRMLRGELPASDLADAIIVGTRRYAKRQETWFRHQLTGSPVVTFDAVEDPADVAQRVADQWEAKGH